MRYTGNKLTTEELSNPHIPRSLEDHLNLSEEQLSISFSEKYRAIHYMNEQFPLQGNIQFYPSDYYDPQIKVPEIVVDTTKENATNQKQWILALSLVAAFIIAFQINGLITKNSSVEPEPKTPLKEASNFSNYMKNAGATLAVTSSKEETALQKTKASKPTITKEQLQFQNSFDLDLPTADLEKMETALAETPNASAEEKTSSKIVEKRNKNNITDTQLKSSNPSLAITDETKTYSSNTPKSTKMEEGVSRESVSLMDQFTTMKSKAGMQGKAYFLKFGASWCLPCQIMEETTFQDPMLLDLIKQSYLYLEVNVDLFDGITLRQKYEVKELPTILIFDKNGQPVEKLEGSISTKDLMKILEKYRGEISLAKV